MKAKISRPRSAIAALAMAAASSLFAPTAQAGLFEDIKEAFSKNGQRGTGDAAATDGDYYKIPPLKEYLKINQPPPGEKLIKPNSITRVLVDAADRKIYVMGFEDSSTEETLLRTYDGFKVGKGGDIDHFGKTHKGDNKTPLGTYPLTKNSGSQFRLAVRIGYPTAAQVQEKIAQEKRTGEKIELGGDVEIHGGYRPGTKLASVPDWTDGCISPPDWVVIQIYNGIREGATISIERHITEAMLAPKNRHEAPIVVAAKSPKQVATIQAAAPAVTMETQETKAEVPTAPPQPWALEERFTGTKINTNVSLLTQEPMGPTELLKFVPADRPNPGIMASGLQTIKTAIKAAVLALK